MLNKASIFCFSLLLASMSPVQVNGKPNACTNALRKFHFVRQADNNSIDVPAS